MAVRSAFDGKNTRGPPDDKGSTSPICGERLRMGALCLPLVWSLPLPPPVSGSTATPPGLRAGALRRVRAGRPPPRFATTRKSPVAI